MGIIIADISVVMTLYHANLLEPACRLDQALCVPDILFERELAANDDVQLQKLGLVVVHLDRDEMTIATQLVRAEPRLCLPAAFGLALAGHRDWTLVVNEPALDRVAKARGVESRDVFWIAGRIETSNLCAEAAIRSGLRHAAQQRECRLNPTEIDRRLQREFGS